MKKLLACILCIGILAVFAPGCQINEPTPETTESSTHPIDPLFDQSYKVVFNAYTALSAPSPEDTPKYCLTYDGFLINGGTSPLQTAKMEPVKFDKEQFLSYCTDYGYWQDYFNPQYICDHVEKAWYGDNLPVDIGVYSTVMHSFYMLLLLDDGELLVCSSNNATDESGNFTGPPIFYRIEVLKPSGNVDSFFSYWDDFYNTELGKQWIEECPESIARWEALQEKYCQ